MRVEKSKRDAEIRLLKSSFLARKFVMSPLLIHANNL